MADDPLRPPPGERSVAELLSFGVVNLDKPAGPPSHQVAAWIRRMANDALAALNAPRIDDVAHAGTLDPKVTGCLPTLLGTATRAARAFRRAEKSYVAVCQLHAAPPDDVREVLAAFEGPIYQKPPRRSAVARRLRVRTLHGLDLLELDRERRRALLRIRCESGTYVRKLCHDVGLALGTGAHMGDLRRTAAGAFDDRDLSTLQDLADGLAWATAADGGPPDESPLREMVAPAEAALSGVGRVTIAESAARAVADGAPVYAPGVLDVDLDLDPDPAPGDDPTAGGEPPLVACYTPGGAAVCLGRLVGDPAAERGTVVDLERVLVSPG
jgi:tRNA pseudouridine55 synthase